MAGHRSKKRAGLTPLRILIIVLAALVVFEFAYLAIRSLRPGDGADTQAVPTAAETPEPTPDVAETPAPTATDAPTAVPTATPEPTEEPRTRPNVLSFYTRTNGFYSPRVRLGDTVKADAWRYSLDLGSYEPMPTTEENLDGKIFPEIFGAVWQSWPDTQGCKIGYHLRYALDDGTEISYNILSPKDIDHTEYIEVWIYDDYHQEPYAYYSHLRESWMTDETLITSIKLTGGHQIKHVREIWLTAFVYTSEDDFDAGQNYTGRVSCDLHIVPN